MPDDRATREAKVLEAVREWLPEVEYGGVTIVITGADPDAADGALFSVTKVRRAFACRRGGES
jgi:hypothetical protein